MSKDYYKILEISRNASEEEIKKAYKRQALKFHPDKNANPEAEDKFKLIAEAYVVLTDSDKRRTHDGAEETFNNPTYSSTTSPKNWPQDPPIKQTLYISLEDLANGVTKKMRILRKVMQLDGSVTLEDKVQLKLKKINLLFNKKHFLCRYCRSMYSLTTSQAPQ